ncbi:MAG: nucleotide exchange factor GrpE [Gemmatimonadota bacterium]|nr:nucleotide exchange factor GrpE [Gemmatimonadota bacterium]MDH3368009.1 nucleotide exchange factor GrpE [Gemmatimonadota bacterium]MDH3477306.1 nucleotide exchange factor GrpE [Gemmatimonadota bacterium]MDH3569825.1 nucleotide exchange factor GrpE [Gemmatimonadota bacterium]MDH5550661.1 nucleotide exchange factor GrpE [Gemmatimonadota bacterium]
MSRKRRKSVEDGEAVEETSVQQANEPVRDEPGVAEVATPPDELDEGVERVEASEAVERLAAELEEQNDRYLRLAAEFDNFRKRAVRERAELRQRSQAEFARKLLEALDDLGRVVALEAANATVHDVINGVHLVEQKLMRELEHAGFQRVGAEGEPFDPNLHEAVATRPASGDGLPGTVGSVLQPGYRLGEVLLRPARVVVWIEGEQQAEGTTADA